MHNAVKEVSEIIRGHLGRGERDRDTIIEGIVSTHPVHSHGAFWLALGCAWLRDKMRTFTGKLTRRNSSQAEALLPGFEHMREAYSIRRKGRVVVVPTYECSNRELRSRALEMETGARGEIDHAREIFVFIEMRGPDGSEEMEPVE
jgi:hypothetical protein